MITQLTYTQARANLAKLLNKVSSNNEIVVINRRNAENIALISESELKSLLETAHLLRSPKNSQRLLAALKKALEKKGRKSSVESIREQFGIK